MENSTPMWRRYLRLFGPDPAADIDAELHFHLQAKVDDLISQGWSAAAAQQEAERQFGDLKAVHAAGIELANERERTRQRSQWWAASLQDMRYALRTLRREQAFTFVTILILALGIAANTTVFSVVNAVLLRPLPFPNPNRLTWFTAGKNLPPDIVKAAGLGAVTFSVSAYEEFQRHNESFEKLTSFNPFYGNSEYTLTGRGEPKPAAGVMVAENFFQTLGVQPAIGRFFSKDECQKGGPRAVLLSDLFWRNQLSADPSVIGRPLTLNNASYTVAGVLPPSFDFGSVFAPGLQMDVYVPAVMQDMRNWGNTLAIVGRLKPGVSVARAQSEADRLFPQLKAANPDWEIDYSSQITSLKDFVSGKLRKSLLMLWWAVGLILLIVCVNLSNLLLARSVARGKEFALRTALGAGRGRLLRQFITEGFILATAGSLLGLVFSFAAATYISHRTAITLPLLSSVKIDNSSLAWTVLLTVATTVLFGCFPALKLASSNTQSSLKESGQGLSAGREHQTLRSMMVVSEVALSCVLLIGAGLLLRSFLAVLESDLGFQPSRAAVMKIDYNSTPAQRGLVLQELLQQVQAIPGIEAAGVADMLPLGRNRSWAFQLRGKTYPPGIPGDIALARIVTPGYLRAMSMHLVFGRDFTWQDSESSTPVVIVNQAAARRFWPGQDPLTQIIHVMGAKAGAHVVGVLSNVRENSLETQPEPEIYLPVTQADPEGAELVVRSSLAPASLAPSIMKALRSLNPAQPASELLPLQEIVDRSISPRRFFALLVAGFAILGLLLASLGIYGVISYSVTRQTQEIGIRMALGASSGTVQRSVIKQTLKLAISGIVLGSIASLAILSWISSLLYGTKATDPLTFGATIVVLFLVALLAGYIPARRASRVDPMLALRAS